MIDNRADLDVKQYYIDKTRPNGYEVDERFLLDDGIRHPLAVICPGGAYRNVCSYIEGVPIAKRLNALGVSAAIVYYRVREQALFPAPQDDLAQAVRETLKKAQRFGFYEESYSVWGFSAGGHLAASFGTANMGAVHYGLPKPAAIVLGYPVLSMQDDLTHKETRGYLLGKHPTDEEKNFADILSHVDPDYPPTYLWAGDADKTVNCENTLRMAALLETADVPHVCEIFPGVPHGMGPGSRTAAAGWIDRAVEFWMKQAAVG